MGYPARLTPAQHVKAFFRSQRNNANDTLAICETVFRPGIYFVSVNTPLCGVKKGRILQFTPGAIFSGKVSSEIYFITYGSTLEPTNFERLFMKVTFFWKLVTLYTLLMLPQFFLVPHITTPRITRSKAI